MKKGHKGILAKLRWTAPVLLSVLLGIAAFVLLEEAEARLLNLTPEDGNLVTVRGTRFQVTLTIENPTNDQRQIAYWLEFYRPSGAALGRNPIGYAEVSIAPGQVFSRVFNLRVPYGAPLNTGYLAQASAAELGSPSNVMTSGFYFEVAARPRQPQYPTNPYVIEIQDQSANGVFAIGDVNNDDQMDYVYVGGVDWDPEFGNSIAAYDHDGARLWIRHETVAYAGHYQAPVVIADVDGDNQNELVVVMNDAITVLDGTTGTTEQARSTGLSWWEGALAGVATADFRGLGGERDIVLQYLNEVKAYRGEDLSLLWHNTNYKGPHHGRVRVADLNNNGRDECAGQRAVKHDGTVMDWGYTFTGHIDYLGLDDVRPDRQGIETILLEEGDNHVTCIGWDNGIIWRVHNFGEPQNAAVGDFDPSRDGLEIWIRSRNNTYQHPWVLDAYGNLIADYDLQSGLPAGWSSEGVEMIFPIDWDGGAKRYCAAKERHTDGKIGVFDAMTGEIVWWADEQAHYLFVGDLAGNGMEEIAIVNGTQIRVYWNDQVDPTTRQESPWLNRTYKRLKGSSNYYSP